MAEVKEKRYDMEAILAEWDTDKQIDETQVNIEICRTPSMHAKYIRYYHYFKEELAYEESRFNRAAFIKRKYYRGECTQEELKKYGWPQFQGLKASNTELRDYLEWDDDMITIRREVAKMKNAVSTLEYILKYISGRDYSIKSLVEYLKYINGA